MPIAKRIFRIFFGWLFVGLGIVGLVLPVLQGILFLATGIALLSPDVPFFRKILEKIKDRYPMLARKAEHISKQIEDS
ncbi:MAG: hypothetical protein DWQ10_00880 [Calditrichaeota bacterium]|nr:MAG: hypothetical protein DWQ10_00880 [Calditrichota bacterium]